MTITNHNKVRSIRIPRFMLRVPTALPSTLCILAILWLTLAPMPTGDVQVSLFPGADKVVHATMFFGLSFCFCFDWWRLHISRTYRRVLSSLLCAVTASIIGIGIEFLQDAFQMGRSFELWDMTADCAGAFLAAALIMNFPFNANSGQE